MENANSLHIITNNNKRVQKKNRLLSIIEYFKDKTGNNRILFLQETYVERKWKDEFSGTVFLFTRYF